MKATIPFSDVEVQSSPRLQRINNFSLGFDNII